VPAQKSVCELADLSALGKIAVRAPIGGAVASALGVPFGRATWDSHGALVVGSGPGDWMVLDEPDITRLERLVAEAGEFASVVDLTHGRALLRITGAGAAELLGGVCALDLSDDAVPDGAALRTSVANVVTDLVRDDVDGVRSYLLHCERSSGQYLADVLLEET
jgi:heterotetrameric sarcosine oxidase gamma subunit